MISVEEALHHVLKSAKRFHSEKRHFLDSAGYALAERIVSKESIPSFDNSAVDGYAVIAADTRRASRDNPAILKVIDEVHAGQVSRKKLKQGFAVHIMTGATLPKGATAVIMVEHTERTGDRVKIFTPAEDGDHFRHAGDDIRKGDTVFKKGHVLRSYDLGVLASIGRPYVKVTAKPTVAILATGDELVGVSDALKPGQIRASTGAVLAQRLHELGCHVMPIGIAKDKRPDLEKKLRKAFAADMILTTGGVSMGERDFVREILKKLRVKIRFWKVRQKPGKPLVFGTSGKKLFLGLPGNPVSSILCFELYAVPAIQAMAGIEWQPLRVKVRLEEAISKKAGLHHYLRVRLKSGPEGVTASLTGSQSSGVMSSLSHAHAVLDLPEASESAPAGALVHAIILDRDAYLALLAHA